MGASYNTMFDKVCAITINNTKTTLKRGGKNYLNILKQKGVEHCIIFLFFQEIIGGLLKLLTL